jgi:hypothetical protein
MDPAAAIAGATLALVVLLAVVRPRIGLTFTPGTAAVLGVFVLLSARILAPADLVQSMAVQWRPLVTLTCILVMTGVVQEVGAFERLTAWIERRARTRAATSTFTVVFALAVITPALLNNDAAILILTPLVGSLVRRLYAGRGIAVAFAFAIFLAPGVAPFIVSNPMNMIVAEFAGLRFNSYAALMLPISLAGALATYTVLRLAFRRELREATPGPAGPQVTIHRHPAERAAVGSCSRCSSHTRSAPRSDSRSGMSRWPARRARSRSAAPTAWPPCGSSRATSRSTSCCSCGASSSSSRGCARWARSISCSRSTARPRTSAPSA